MSKDIWDYRQPEFYRFNQDSLFLVEYILENHKDQYFEKILDAGAGCGVIGLELAQRLESIPLEILCVERLEEFRDSLEHNIEKIQKDLKERCKIDFQIAALESRQWGEFDLVVSNPPYFLPDKGIKSPNSLKQQCRSFEFSDPQHFINSLAAHLRPNGIGYFLGRRDLWEHVFHLKAEALRGDVGIYRVFCDSNCK